LLLLLLLLSSLLLLLLLLLLLFASSAAAMDRLRCRFRRHSRRAASSRPACHLLSAAGTWAE
jgi:hypothetical protein